MPSTGTIALRPAARLSLPALRRDQWAIAHHPAKVKVVCMGRRWGKSVLGGCIALAAASQGAKVAWCVPAYRNGRPLWRWAEGAVAGLRRANLANVNRADRIIEFPGTGGFVSIYSMDNADSIRGEWFHLVIVDEAAMVAEEAWTDAIQPTLADAQGDALLISSPKGKNWFWQEWQRGYAAMSGDIAAWTAPSSANPSPHIQRAAQLAKERIPDAKYRQEWLAEFVETATDTFSRDWFADNRYDPTAPRRPQRDCIARWLSWDTGFKDTKDAAYSSCSVWDLTADYHLQLREVWRDQVTFPNLLHHIKRLAEQWRCPELQGIVIEDKASGTSAYQTLVEATDDWLSTLIIPFSPQGSKEQRAAQAAVWCKHECVQLPKPEPSVPWLFAFEEELFSFPQSPYKDQVDCFSQAILYVEHYLAEGWRARTRQQSRP